MSNNQQAMTKSEFMTRYINEKYEKRRKQKGADADSFLIETCLSRKRKTQNNKLKGAKNYD